MVTILMYSNFIIILNLSMLFLFRLEIHILRAANYKV